MNRTILGSMTLIVVYIVSGLSLFMSSVSASIVFNDSRSLTLGNNSLTLYMGQDGDNFYLDTVNPSGKTLSCEVKAGNTTLIQRSNCDNQNFSYNGSNNITIYVQLDNDQGTWIYDTYSRQFTSVLRGTTDVTSSTNNNISNNNIISTRSFFVDVSTSNPLINQSVSTNITARDSNGNRNFNYQGTVRYSIEKRDNNNSSWYTASNNDYDLSQTTSFLGQNQQGYLSLLNYIRFYNSGLYRLKVTDDANTTIVGYREFDVSTNNSFSNQSNSLTVDVSTTNPSLSQYINTTTTIKDSNGNRNFSYQGTVRYSIEKRDNNSSFWYTASNSDYFLSPSAYYFDTNDQGFKPLSSHVIFYNNGSYRIRAYDDNNFLINSYSSTITVGNSSLSNSYNRFDLGTNITNPSRDTFVSLTITPKDTNGFTLFSYNNRVRFQIFRRMNTSDSWIDITSSNVDNSAYRIYDTSYLFSSNNNGSITLNNFIKFYSDSYDYKLRVVDDNNINIYGEIIYYVRNSSFNSNNTNNFPVSVSSAYRFGGVLDAAVPSLNSNFDVKLYVRDLSNRSVIDYNRTVTISLERKSLAGSTIWRTAGSTYCRLERNSYSFSSNDLGYINLRNIARCSKKGFYRLRFVDTNNTSVYGYIYFTVLDTDDFVEFLPGFTRDQRESTHELYRTFMSKVNEQELNNISLARNPTWADTRRNYYNKLNALAYNKIDRLRNYSELGDAANDFTNDYERLRR